MSFHARKKPQIINSLVTRLKHSSYQDSALGHLRRPLARSCIVPPRATSITPLNANPEPPSRESEAYPGGRAVRSAIVPVWGSASLNRCAASNPQPPLAELIGGKRALYLHCEACGYSAWMDLNALAETHGGTTLVARMIRRAVCTRCRARAREVVAACPSARS
jgi:hypothetical protein